MEGSNIQPPPPSQDRAPGDLKLKKEAASFVLELRSILGPYQLKIDSSQEDISALDQKVKGDLTSTIKDLLKERGIYYANKESQMVVGEIKKMVGDTLGALIEKIAFGNANNETMDEVIEGTASALSVEIDDNASSVLKRVDIPSDEKTERIAEFAEEKIKGATSDNRWTPTNLKKLLNKIMDFVRTPWNGSTIKSLIFNIGKKIIKEKEEEFIEHGI